MITPTGRLVVTEHVLGSALPFVPSISPQRAWRELRLAVPADEPRPFGQRSDILQVGLCAVALLLSRPLRLDDYPQRLRALLDRATESKLTGERRPLRQPLRAWIEHMLGLAPGTPAATVHDAREGLDRLVSREGYLATPTGLVGLLESVEAYCSGDMVPGVAGPEAVATPQPVSEPEPPPFVFQAPHHEPLAAAEHAPDVVAPPEPEAEPEAEPELPAPSLDADALDLAPGPRPAWPLQGDTPEEVESFAPEPGFAFTPDEPTPEEPSAPAPPVAVSAHAAHGDPATTGRHQAPWPRSTPGGSQEVTLRFRSQPPGGPFDAVPAPPPVPRASGSVPVPPADSFVEPIAASVEEHDVDVASRKTGQHRLRSGATSSAGSMFGAPHADDEEAAAPPARAFNVRWVAAAAVGCLALIGMAGGWALMGTSAKETSAQAPAASDGQAGQEEGDTSPARQPHGGRAAEPAARPALTPQAASPAALPAPPPVPTGELRVLAPFPLEVFEAGVKVGTSDAPIQLTAEGTASRW